MGVRAGQKTAYTKTRQYLMAPLIHFHFIVGDGTDEDRNISRSPTLDFQGFSPMTGEVACPDHFHWAWSMILVNSRSSAETHEVPETGL